MHTPMDLIRCALACPAAAFTSVVIRKTEDLICKLPILSHLYKSTSDHRYNISYTIIIYHSHKSLSTNCREDTKLATIIIMEFLIAEACVRIYVLTILCL